MSHDSQCVKSSSVNKRLTPSAGLDEGRKKMVPRDREEASSLLAPGAARWLGWPSLRAAAPLCGLDSGAAVTLATWRHLMSPLCHPKSRAGRVVPTKSTT